MEVAQVMARRARGWGRCLFFNAVGVSLNSDLGGRSVILLTTCIWIGALAISVTRLAAGARYNAADVLGSFGLHIRLFARSRVHGHVCRPAAGSKQDWAAGGGARPQPRNRFQKQEPQPAATGDGGRCRNTV